MIDPIEKDLAELFTACRYNDGGTPEMCELINIVSALTQRIIELEHRAKQIQQPICHPITTTLPPGNS